jgi:GTP-binding protein
MTIGINTSPLAGKSGKKLTARLVKARLDQELIGNVSIKVLPTERPDTWEVQGRGELQLAVLVEMMRREGFELTVGKPEVLTARSTASCTSRSSASPSTSPRSTSAPSPSSWAPAGRMEQMINHGTGWVRLEFVVPARGLIGFRTEFLTETRGTGIMNHVFEGYEPWAGEIRPARPGSLVADRMGSVTATRCSTCRSAASCSSPPATRCTRA